MLIGHPLMDGIILEQLIQTPVEKQVCELVERKGLGHPDSICDAIVNHASVALCGQYKKEFGRILHHNLDKAMIIEECPRRSLAAAVSKHRCV